MAFEPNAVELVREALALDHLQVTAERRFGDFLKAVVDMHLGTMAVARELHGDEEAMMLDAGSEQADLWGINLYAAEYGATGWLAFDSMMNVLTAAPSMPASCLRHGRSAKPQRRPRAAFSSIRALTIRSTSVAGRGLSAWKRIVAFPVT